MSSSRSSRKAGGKTSSVATVRSPTTMSGSHPGGGATPKPWQKPRTNAGDRQVSHRLNEWTRSKALTISLLVILPLSGSAAVGRHLMLLVLRTWPHE